MTWAVPLDDDGRPSPLPAGQVVHAPTPSDEPLSLPARLIAPFPLGPDRRHVAPGGVTDALVAAAAETYADLLAGLPADPVLLALVPRIGLAGAALDAALGAAVLDRLRAIAWLPVAGDDELRQPPTAPRCWTRPPTSGSRRSPASCRGCCPPPGPGGRISPP